MFQGRKFPGDIRCLADSSNAPSITSRPLEMLMATLVWTAKMQNQCQESNPKSKCLRERTIFHMMLIGKLTASAKGNISHMTLTHNLSELRRHFRSTAPCLSLWPPELWPRRPFNLTHSLWNRYRFVQALSSDNFRFIFSKCNALRGIWSHPRKCLPYVGEQEHNSCSYGSRVGFAGYNLHSWTSPTSCTT